MTKNINAMDIEDLELESKELASMCRVLSDAILYSPCEQSDYKHATALLADLMKYHSEKMSMLVEQEYENKKENVA